MRLFPKHTNRAFHDHFAALLGFPLKKPCTLWTVYG
jgi:hypothetical protein